MKTDAGPDTGSPSLFDDAALALDVFRTVRRLLEEIGDVDVRITSSQASFRRRRGFAYVWTPSAWTDAPDDVVVLSIALDHAIPSPRFKQVLEPAPGRWMHDLEVRSPGEIDDEVAGWLAQAWAWAGDALNDG
jgi:hypothetical protein